MLSLKERVSLQNISRTFTALGFRTDKHAQQPWLVDATSKDFTSLGQTTGSRIDNATIIAEFATHFEVSQ